MPSPFKPFAKEDILSGNEVCVGGAFFDGCLEFIRQSRGDLFIGIKVKYPVTAAFLYSFLLVDIYIGIVLYNKYLRGIFGGDLDRIIR